MRGAGFGASRAGSRRVRQSHSKSLLRRGSARTYVVSDALTPGGDVARKLRCR
jgi:hypothetical protein